MIVRPKLGFGLRIGMDGLELRPRHLGHLGLHVFERCEKRTARLVVLRKRLIKAIVSISCFDQWLRGFVEGKDI